MATKFYFNLESQNLESMESMLDDFTHMLYDLNENIMSMSFNDYMEDMVGSDWLEVDDLVGFDQYVETITPLYFLASENTVYTETAIVERYIDLIREGYLNDTSLDDYMSDMLETKYIENSVEIINHMNYAS